MNISVWNTGKKYEAAGQILGAKQIEDGILFVDASRGITGFIPNESAFAFIYDVFTLNSYALEKEVMFSYDCGMYDETFPYTNEAHNICEDIIDAIKAFKAFKAAGRAA